jgi:hypothetical protein
VITGAGLGLGLGVFVDLDLSYCLLDQFKSFNIVFIFQRHNTIEHAGHMSRSQRNAALQVHVIFTFRTHP